MYVCVAGYHAMLHLCPLPQRQCRLGRLLVASLLFAMATRRALVFGANGALGKAVMQRFAAAGVNTYGIDLAASDAATMGNTIIQPGMTIPAMQSAVVADVAKLNMKFDAIVNVAGGWAGGDVASADTAAAAQLMFEQSVYSSFVAAYLAAHYTLPKGLLVLPGAAAALPDSDPKTFMVGYDVAKTAVHRLIRTIAADDKALPEGGCVVGVLPTTIDTPGNRAAMPGDFSAWTPTAEFADDILQWSMGEARPKSGSLVVYTTTAGKTERTQH